MNVLEAANLNGASTTRRILGIPAPAGRREPVVRDALAALAAERKESVESAEEAIEENGLTIEVIRLRDRLMALPLTHLQRLLLSTEGVTETLFLNAIEDQLDNDDEAYEASPLESLDHFGDTLARSFSVALEGLAESMGKAITEGLRTREPTSSSGRPSKAEADEGHAAPPARTPKRPQGGTRPTTEAEGSTK